MLGFLVSVIMAIIIGFIGDALVRSDMPGGVIGSMIAGFIGAWLGHFLFGHFGPDIAGFAIIPAIIGAALVVFLVGLLFKGMRSRTTH
ncbi:GlsB/YeaQ/YmgE family stress response membrane protein [Paenibacillus aurantius]|uniref:GlsB/YeaQ/YmgE family stress response membrane protein n=1 Tax=Paenibacillus aurantius TaxID=2918900 RepID=A0AA96RCG4_9BACL|nr:GlsB/YeaQ/YmgE family stress response membrane protein [Paenibacillus aurantius]WJH35233.1 GlsB/YeaQ/YmgE family stress response membrane protein [Paenibacillus sp. CC-CFT747]WNQ10510.1 GlsB/YeaQ/YmgE family stress response membrane protein [Paenibacillus aurantius]